MQLIIACIFLGPENNRTILIIGNDARLLQPGHRAQTAAFINKIVIYLYTCRKLDTWE